LTWHRSEQRRGVTASTASKLANNSSGSSSDVRAIAVDIVLNFIRFDFEAKRESENFFFSWFLSLARGKKMSSLSSKVKQIVDRIRCTNVSKAQTYREWEHVVSVSGKKYTMIWKRSDHHLNFTFASLADMSVQLSFSVNDQGLWSQQTDADEKEYEFELYAALCHLVPRKSEKKESQWIEEIYTSFLEQRKYCGYIYQYSLNPLSFALVKELGGIPRTIEFHWRSTPNSLFDTVIFRRSFFTRKWFVIYASCMYIENAPPMHEEKIQKIISAFEDHLR